MYVKHNPWYLRFADGDEGGSGGGGGGGGGSTWTPPSSQEELNRIISERVARERSKYADYNDLKDRAAKWDEHQTKDQSETQKLTSERDKFKLQAETLQKKLDRMDLAKKVAKDKKIDDPDLLVGDTEEEMTAFADKLLAFKGVSGDGDQGGSGEGSGQQQGTDGGKPKTGYVPTAGTGGGAAKGGVSAGRDWFAETHPSKS